MVFDNIVVFGKVVLIGKVVIFGLVVVFGAVLVFGEVVVLGDQTRNHGKQTTDETSENGHLDMYSRYSRRNMKNGVGNISSLLQRHALSNQ